MVIIDIAFFLFWSWATIQALICKRWGNKKTPKQKHVNNPKMSKLCRKIWAAGESSAHLWISHLPHALHQNTGINIFIAIHVNMPSKLFFISCKTSAGETLFLMRHWHGTASQSSRDRCLGPLLILCPPFAEYVTRDARSSQVRRATRPLLDKPKLKRGDGGIAPPVMVPELALIIGLSTELHGQRGARSSPDMIY